MEATLTLTQAGEKLGVDQDTLSRLIREGMLPEARQFRRSESGELVWMIPAERLTEVASRHGWVIDLRGDDTDGPPESPGLTDGPSRYVRAMPRSTGPVTEASPDPDRTGAPQVGGVAVASSPEPSASGAVGLAPGRVEPPAPPMAVQPLQGTAPEIISAEEAKTVPSVSDVIDMELLDRLLGAQEARAVARAEVEHTKSALESLNSAHARVTNELEIERRERMMAAERFREERLARAQSDAKVAELRDRVAREMALAEAEKAARQAALDRIAQVEREAANAYSVLTRRGRRRFRRLVE